MNRLASVTWFSFYYFKQTDFSFVFNFKQQKAIKLIVVEEINQLVYGYFTLNLIFAKHHDFSTLIYVATTHGYC